MLPDPKAMTEAQEEDHRAYIQMLRNMTPEQRLQKAFEISAFTKALFKEGLRLRFPEKSEEEIHQIYLARLELCHNRNY